MSTLITAGPYRLNPGDQAEVAFALMAAFGEEDINAYADQAQWYWDNVIQPMDPNPVSIEDAPIEAPMFDLAPPFPNPAVGEVVLPFSIPTLWRYRQYGRSHGEHWRERSHPALGSDRTPPL